MKITRRSGFSNIVRTKEINITEKELKRWHRGEHIQNVVPHLSADDREFIMTGITAEEWDTLLPAEEEE